MVEFFGVVEGEVPTNYGIGSYAKGIILQAYPTTLEDLLFKKSDPLSIKDKVHILNEIMKGVVNLHSLGIIHGDLKPQNILLSEHNPHLVKLCDFGLSHIRYSLNERKELSSSTIQYTSHFQGTKDYSAPG